MFIYFSPGTARATFLARMHSPHLIRPLEIMTARFYRAANFEVIFSAEEKEESGESESAGNWGWSSARDETSLQFRLVSRKKFTRLVSSPVD